MRQTICRLFFMLKLFKYSAGCETIPVTFDFKEGEGKEDFVIRNVSLK